MAKVTNPLLSREAHGRVGDKMVFYGRGLVRAWDVQIDPRTAQQLQFRTVVRELMQMIKISNGLDRAWLRNNFAKSWHTKLVSWLTRDELAQAQIYRTTWWALTDEQRQAWESMVPTE
jgi:hypothetical protein